MHASYHLQLRSKEVTLIVGCLRHCSSFNNFCCILSLNSYLLNKQYRGRPANILHTRKASSIEVLCTVCTATVRDLYLTHTHLGSRPFHQLPRPSPLQNLILPLLDNMSTFHAPSCRGYREKRWTDGRTHAHAHIHTHTHRQTDCNNPPLRMRAGEG